MRKATVKATTMCIVLLITQAHYAEIKLMFPELDVELKNLMAKRKAEIAAKQANPPLAAAVSTDTSAAQSDTLQKDPPRLKRNLTVSSLFGAHRFDFLRSICYQLQWRRQFAIAFARLISAASGCSLRLACELGSRSQLNDRAWRGTCRRQGHLGHDIPAVAAVVRAAWFIIAGLKR